MTDFHHDIFKMVALVIIFAVGMAGGLIAIGKSNSDRAQLAFSIGGVFAGGIFLGAGLIHLLPDGIKSLAQYFSGIDFPLGYFIAAIGFLVVLFIEEILFGDVHDQIHETGAAEGAEGHDAATRFSAYSLVVILSLHSILAGAALGTEDEFSGSFVIFLAIIAHKGAAGFALTLDFQRAAFNKAKSLRMLAMFAMMTPLGIIIGTGLDKLLHERYGPLTEGLFDSLAAGTFLYVAIVEIIGKEFVDRRAMMEKFVALSAGLGLMALIALFV